MSNYHPVSFRHQLFPFIDRWRTRVHTMRASRSFASPEVAFPLTSCLPTVITAERGYARLSWHSPLHPLLNDNFGCVKNTRFSELVFAKGLSSDGQSMRAMLSSRPSSVSVICSQNFNNHVYVHLRDIVSCTLRCVCLVNLVHAVQRLCTDFFFLEQQLATTNASSSLVKWSPRLEISPNSIMASIGPL